MKTVIDKLKHIIILISGHLTRTVLFCFCCVNRKNRTFFPYSQKHNEHNFSNQLSIIIPVYNDEKNIKQCLDSVISQKTNYPYEVIVINDGSTDNTLNILLAYGGKIRVINQKNAGVGAARNKGISEAKFANIMFIDSDDYLDYDYIEKMMNIKTKGNHAIVCSNYKKFSETLNLGVSQFLGIYEGYEQVVKLPGYPWGKIYDKHLFINHLFPEGLWFEDTLISLDIYSQVNSVVVVSDTYYNYRDNPYGYSNASKKDIRTLDVWSVTKKLISDRIITLSTPELEFLLWQVTAMTCSRIRKMGHIMIKKVLADINKTLSTVLKKHKYSKRKFYIMEKAIIKRRVLPYKFVSFGYRF